MRYSKVLLVRLAYLDFLGNNRTPPIGLGYIAEALKVANIDYEIFDMGLSGMGNRDFGEKQLFKQIEDYKPDLIGITMKTLQYLHHYKLCERIKKAFPGIDIVLGGQHISSYREDVLRECHAIDVGVVLEGEETILELCDGKPLADITGLLHRVGDKIVFNGERKRRKDLDNIPYPRFDKFPMESYLSDSIGIVTTRGCPYKCTYCSVALAIGRKMSFRTPESIMEEIDYWYKRGKRRMLIYDDNFTLVPKPVLELCDLLKKKNYPDIEFAIPNGLRADRLNREMLTRMREVGFKMIAIGVESANDDVLAVMRKAEKLEHIDRAIGIATELGYDVYLFFIIGMPGETPEAARKTMQFALKHPIADAAFFNPIPYPGTELYDQVYEKKYLILKPEYYLNEFTYNTDEPAFVTPEFSFDDRVKMLKEARKVTQQIRVRNRLKKVKRFKLIMRPIAHLVSSRVYQHIMNDSPFAVRVHSTLKRLVQIA